MKKLMIDAKWYNAVPIAPADTSGKNCIFYHNQWFELKEEKEKNVYSYSRHAGGFKVVHWEAVGKQETLICTTQDAEKAHFISNACNLLSLG